MLSSQGEVKSCRLPSNCDCRIVFSFGANDTTVENGKRRVEVADSLNYARQILNLAKHHYPVLMISPAPILDAAQNQRTIDLSQQLAQLCNEISIPYLDVFTPLSVSTIWIQEVEAGDGAHPDIGGYSEYAQLVQNWSAWMEWFKEF